jgi:hypothetical protein
MPTEVGAATHLDRSLRFVGMSILIEPLLVRRTSLKPLVAPGILLGEFPHHVLNAPLNGRVGDLRVGIVDSRARRLVVNLVTGPTAQPLRIDEDHRRSASPGQAGDQHHSVGIDAKKGV